MAPERDEGGWYREQRTLGFNYRLTDLQSALGRSQLGKLEAFVERRNEIARPLPRGARRTSTRWSWRPPRRPVRATPTTCSPSAIATARRARRRLYDALRERGILCQVHYLPVYRHPWYAETYGYEAGPVPGGGALLRRLPLAAVLPGADAGRSRTA